MADANLQVALVGAGRIAGAFAAPGDAPITHAAAINALPGVTLAAICDPATEARAAFAQRWRVPVQVASIAELDVSFDIIVVAVPDDLHVKTAIQILHKVPPRLLLMEKPLCVSQDELAPLAAALAANSKCNLAVNSSRRFDAGHSAVRALLALEELGPLVDIRWVYYGGWLHNGVHVIDTLRMLLDDTLDCHWARLGYPGAAGDPCIEAEFRPRKNPDVRVLIESFPEDAFQLFEAEIRCRDGRVRLLDFGDEILVDRVWVNNKMERELKITTPLPHDNSTPSMLAFYQSATRYLREGDNGLIEKAGFATAAETMRILFETRKRV
ncbi:MAG: Gfo/Idh/MocA family oxidoreductase [Pseudomonadota bacterium]